MTFFNRYIQENYSKIRNVERELASLAFEMKLTSGPKKQVLEQTSLYQPSIF
jgi:hypothetical protein